MRRDGSGLALALAGPLVDVKLFELQGQLIDLTLQTLGSLSKEHAFELTDQHPEPNDLGLVITLGFFEGLRLDSEGITLESERIDKGNLRRQQGLEFFDIVRQ